MRSHYDVIELDTDPGIAVYDLTPHVRALLEERDINDGVAVISSRHTTTAITVNEHELRLVDDLRLFLQRLVPPGAPYLHNDIHLRDCPADEPENAHAHIAAMLMGQSETIGITDGELTLGTWQSILLVELDGPRRRTVGVQLLGD
jgi:secondary thiamine-phosphate synthase enzyme